MGFWDKVKYFAYQVMSLTPSGQALYWRQAAAVMHQENPDLPPSVGEMAQSGVESVGKAIGSIWTWVKILAVGGVIIFIIWAFIGRKK